MTHVQSSFRRPVLIYGAGGFAREVAWLVENVTGGAKGLYPAGFIDDSPVHHGELLNDLPVMDLATASARFPSALVTIAVGNSKTRGQLATRVESAGFGFVDLVHATAQSSRWNRFGEGVVVCSNCIVTTNVKLGKHAQINLSCTIGHDVEAGDFLTLAPGVHISGYVKLGHRVQIGTGAVFIHGTAREPLIIGDDVVVGAGACVTRNVESGATVVGVPARPVKYG